MSGAGTGECRRCGGVKEASRLGSHNCKQCDKRRPVEKRVRLVLDLPQGVMARLIAEAGDEPVGRHVRDLLIARDERRVSGNDG